MRRRRFIKSTALAVLAMGLGDCNGKSKTHILTLSFDDGFRNSFYRIADIHEEYGLKACLNVIASGHLPSFIPQDKYQMIPMGDFVDWNKLKNRGHEVMPHSWAHLNLTELPLEKAKENIDKCLYYFETNLEGFQTSEAVYNFAFNASNQILEDYLLERVRAVRTGTWNVFGSGEKTNPFPNSKGPFKLGCLSYGPDNADEWVEKEVKEFLNSSGGWLILNLHGLDKEGWGPISTNYLDKLLKRLKKIDYLEILPSGEVLKRV